MNIENGTIINQYKILSKIGKGGMGEVYLAEDTKLDRQVALKILPAEFAEDKDRMSRFVREAKSASALNHPNIITIHEIGEFDNAHYIATEYIEGKTLNKYLKGNKIKFGSVLDIAIQIASALDEAHTAGIVHRDIKPDNVMIRENGLAKILDFGIAKLTEKQNPEIESEDATAIHVSTTPGMIIGTANYMSPEQAKGQEVDTRTDIFSFGVVLYEMLSGYLPFEGETPMEIIAAIINKEPKPLDNTDIPPEVKKIIVKTLRKDRDERYQTIKGLLADLKEVKQELEFQDKLEKTVSPNKEEPKTQMLKATTIGEQNTTNETINDSITIKKSGLSKALVGVLAVLVISAIGLGYWYFSSSNQIESIAVMPFVNESGNKDLEYLSDGMTETLISSLSELPDLSVKARSTVFFYKGKNMSPKKLGEDLGVEAVLLGRITERGDDLKLSLELVNTTTQDVIWSKQYNRKGNDLVALQDEIARDVSSSLKTKLTDTDEEKLAKTYTADPQAYRDYLQGRYYWNKRNGADLRKAIEQFEAAVKRDPEYALAYVGLADSYGVFGWWDDDPPDDALQKAKQYAERALEIDDSLGEAHASLAFVNQHLWNWAEAEKGFKRAIEISPDYASAHKWYGDLLILLGRVDKATGEFKKAYELEPLSVIVNYNLANHYCHKRDSKAAMEYAKRVIELNPNFAGGPNLMSCIYRLEGRDSEALVELKKAVELSKRQISWVVASLGTAYAINGQNEKARAIIKEMEEVYVSRKKNAVEIALIYAELGEKDEAFKWLEKDVESRGYRMPIMILQDSRFGSLKSDKRYAAILRRMGLPER